MFTVFLILIWFAVGVRLPTLWRDSRQRALSSSGVALALATTAAYPPIALALHQPLVPHLLGLIAAYFRLRFISMVTGVSTRRWLTGSTAAVLLTLGVLAVASGGIDTSADLVDRHLTPATVAYWVVFEGYLGTVMAVSAALFLTVARAAPPGPPRTGLHMVAAGSMLVALYAGAKTIMIVGDVLVAPVNFLKIEPVAHAGQGVGILLVITGSLTTATGRARAAARAYRSLVELRPLWKAMRDAFPEVILFTPRRAVFELAGVDDVDLRLYRRLIEIRDGMLSLREHLGEPVPPAGDPAVTEARRIALALRRRAAGGPASGPGNGWAAGPGSGWAAGGPGDGWAAGPGSGWAAGGPGDGWAPVGPDLADEVAWLRRVSRAYRRLGRDEVVTDVARIPRSSGSVR